MKLSTASSLVALLLSQCLCASAQAAPASALEALQQFNLIAFGDVNSTSHVDGRSYIGGNLTGGDFVQHPASTPASAYAGLTVRGNASNVTVNGLGAVVGGKLSGNVINSGAAAVLGNSSNVNFNNAAYVGGSASATNFNGGRISDLANNAALLGQVAAATSTDLKATLSGLSDQLSHLSSAGSSVNINGNRVTFNALADANGTAVFDLTAIDAIIFSLGEFEFNLNNATTIIFNTDETTYNISANFLGGSATLIGQKAIWNFYNATDLTLNSQFGGVVLATDAALENTQNIEGTVVVNSLTQSGEIHQQSFTGDVPEQKLPEPGSLGLLLGSLALLALRRKAAARG